MSLHTFIKMISIKTTNIRPAAIIFVFFIFLRASPVFSQVYGCTDSSANNYNPSATINDGSCTYNFTAYTPQVVLDSISDILRESSGLQWAGNSLWSFNDKNGTPDLYRIDTASAAILQTVRLTGAANVDWEETAFDGTYFYVGDFGNNLDGARNDLKIYKFPFSAIPDYTTNPETAIPSDQIEIINFTYSDQPQPLEPAPLDSTKFDCEAMIVSGGKIHLFTKGWIDLTSKHYVINSTLAGDYAATLAETFETGYLVTGAAKAPGKEVAALLGYQNFGFGNHFIHLLYDYSEGKYFNGNKRQINLPGASEMGQAEGITFRDGGYGYISNERFETSFGPLNITVNQKLRSFNITGFVPSNVLALYLKGFSVNKINAADKIVWEFNLPVHNLQIQQSGDGITFTTLKTYDISTAGSFSNKPASSISYYRMVWQENDGMLKYSEIISLRNEVKNIVSNVLLKANGELSFMLNGSRDEFFTFTLHTTDGKALSHVPKRSYKPGFNRINLSSNNAINGVVLLGIYSSEQKRSILLQVVK